MEGIEVVLFLCASGQQRRTKITFHLGARNMKFIDCQSPFGIWMKLAVRQVCFNTVLSAQQLVLSVEEVLPAVLTRILLFFGRLGNQVDWSERREEKVSSFIGDHQDLVSKRDEFQLVKRQGPACLAIASYSVKGMNGFESPALHCTAFLDGRFWATTLRGRCFIEIGIAGAVGLPRSRANTSTCGRCKMASSSSRGDSFKTFLAERKAEYRSKFPFLTESQIVAKLKRLWNNLQAREAAVKSKCETAHMKKDYLI